MTPHTPRDSQNESGTAAARPGLQAFVQCEGFRCLAYCDAKGQWRDCERHELLPKVLAVLEVVAE